MSNNPTSIFIVDNHPMFMEGLKSAFVNNNDFRIIGIANSIKHTQLSHNLNEIHIVFIGINFPDDVELDYFHLIKDNYPNTKIIALFHDFYINALSKAWINKADALLMKGFDNVELFSIIESVLLDLRIISRNVPEFRSKQSQ